MIMFFFFFLVLFVYMLIILSSIYGFFVLSNKIPSPNINYNIKVKSISVLVPFRNEALRIQQLLDSFNIQVETSIIKEIIFIDDHSTDNSSEIISQWINSTNIDSKILSMEENKGKKNAINLGFKNASSRYVLTLDSDVNFNKYFFLKIRNEISFDKGLYIFPVVENFGFVYSQIQSHVLSVFTIGMLNLKHPVLANGACLLINRDDFLYVNPFKDNYNIHSGDDLFILEVFKKNNLSIVATSPYLFSIYTSGPETLRSYISRSLRWSGKMSNVKLSSTKLYGIIILMTNLITLIMLYQVIFNYSIEAFSYLLIKLGLDLTISFLSTYHFKNKKIFLFSLPLFFLYPFFLLTNSILLIFNYPNYWKGRKVMNSSN